MSTLNDLLVIYGCMYANKSTELINLANKLTNHGYKVLAIKFIDDTRYEPHNENGVTSIISHNGISYPAVSVRYLNDCVDKLSDVDTVIIDEGQFFSDLIEFAELVCGMKKTIVVAGLDLTFQKLPFGQMPELIKKASWSMKLRAKCNCGAPAEFTKRIVASTEVVLIGGSEMYLPVCEKCW
jgi:thymidine kinase